MNRRLSLTNLSYTEEMKAKLQKLDLVRNATKDTTVQSNRFSKTNTKLNTSIKQKSIISTKKKRTLQSLPYSSYQANLSNDKLMLNDSKDKKPQVNNSLRLFSRVSYFNCIRKQTLKEFRFSFIHQSSTIIY
jgi:hypothetical protein